MPDQNQVTAQFEFEIEDWLAFQKHFLLNSTKFKRTKMIMTFYLPVLLAVIMLVEYRVLSKNPFFIIIAIIASALWIIFYPKRLERRTLNNAEKMINSGDNSGVLGENTVALSDEFVLYITPESECKYKWSGVKKIEETDEYYFLFLSALTAIIIPKKKVESEIQEFDKYLKHRISDI